MNFFFTGLYDSISVQETLDILIMVANGLKTSLLHVTIL